MNVCACVCVVPFRYQNIHIQHLVVTRETCLPAPHLPPPLRPPSENLWEKRRRPGLYSLARATWPRLMPVPRIPTVSTVSRSPAALPAAPLPLKMRLAFCWRRPRPGGGERRRGWGRAGAGLRAPTPASPAGSPRPPPPRLRAESRGINPPRGAEDGLASRARPLTRGKTLTSVAVALRGPQERAGSAALLQPCSPRSPSAENLPLRLSSHPIWGSTPAAWEAPPLPLGRALPPWWSRVPFRGLRLSYSGSDILNGRR